MSFAPMANDTRIPTIRDLTKSYLPTSGPTGGLVQRLPVEYELIPHSSVKLHVSIGKYWVSLYVLVCMVVCIVEHIGMY